MKGIILAAGKGTRMYPMTIPICKPLLPIYDKPNIYYSLTILMKAHIKDILVIVPPGQVQPFNELLGDGTSLGISISYKEQPVQRGIADAFIVGEEFIDGDSVCLILGDNIFYGPGFDIDLEKACAQKSGATIFGYYVEDPRPFGVVEFDKKQNVVSLEEKPEKPKSHYIVPGLYFYDSRVVEIAKGLPPSARGELEITDVNKAYLSQGELKVVPLGHRFHWFDTGNAESMFAAAGDIRTIQHEKKILVGCPEETAYRLGYISEPQLMEIAGAMRMTDYGKYLSQIPYMT